MRTLGTGLPLAPGPVCPPCEAWRLGWMVYEMWFASAYNIASRTSWLSGSRPGSDPTGTAALHEWQRMWTEKMCAGVEVGMEMQRAGMELMLGRFNPLTSGQRLVGPLHQRTVSNTKRLSRRDRIGA